MLLISKPLVIAHSGNNTILISVYPVSVDNKDTTRITLKRYNIVIQWDRESLLYILIPDNLRSFGTLAHVVLVCQQT